jgi:hypothetical protein
VVDPDLLGEHDLEHQEIGGPDRDGLVPREDAELTHQDALSELREMEGRGVAAGWAPEAGRDRRHEPTFNPVYCLTITLFKRLGDGGQHGGYPRYENVMEAASSAAVPSGGIPAGRELSRQHRPGSIEVRGW